ncbi:MAG TPA: CPBP family intramembrane metalloprotease, partial [Oceanospirillales bacterium]|nr:CPBP family intramembrane metalloprotease [Oceanospirillales bacterium]
SWTQAPSLFIASLAYIYLTYKAKSIVPAIIAHILNNSMTFFYYLALLKQTTLANHPIAGF